MGAGAALRSWRPTARLLTEVQVRRLRRNPAQPEFAWCCRIAAPGSTVVEVGASVGNYALALKKAVGRDGRVLAFEPNPEVYAALVRSTWLTGVETSSLALAAETGEQTLYVPADADGCAMAPMGSLVPPDTRADRTTVRTGRLDDVDVPGPVSLVLIDVEGAERQVLQGGRAFLAAHRPALVVEIEQRHLGAEPIDVLVQDLTEWGYCCAAISANGLVPWERFDVARDQLRFVESRTRLRPDAPGRYLNNFLCWLPDAAWVPDPNDFRDD